jgi:hypothetical protein
MSAVKTEFNWSDRNDARTKLVRWDIPRDAKLVAEVRDALEAEYKVDYVHVVQDTIYSTDDIKRYTDTNFFDPATMKWHNSRLGRERLIGEAIFFVTSDKDDYPYGDPQPRKWTLRIWYRGEFHRFSELGEYSSSRAANKALDAIPADLDELIASDYQGLLD